MGDCHKGGCCKGWAAGWGRHSRAAKPADWWHPKLFEFFHVAGPVIFEEARERAVGEDSSAILAGGAVVGFILGINDSLDGSIADGAGLVVAAVRGEVGAEGGDVSRAGEAAATGVEGE